MNAALIGSVSSSAATLRGMIRGGLEVIGVCGLDRQHGQSVSDYVDLQPWCESAGIPFLPFARVVEPEVTAFLHQHRPDWLFVIGLSQMIPEPLRAIARQGAIGFHPTCLPKGRGRAPVAWTILLQQPAAANLFFLTDEPDAGDIIEQRPVAVDEHDYAADLIERTNVVLEQMVADLSSAFAQGPVPRTPQDHTQATFYPRRRPEDGWIDWHRPADEIYRLIRAVSHPYPGAFTHRIGQPLMIWRAEPVDMPVEATTIGTVVAVEDGYPVVKTGDGGITLREWSLADVPQAPLAVGDVLD